MRTLFWSCVTVPMVVGVGVALPAQNWTQRNTLTAPPARSGHAMAYDVGRGVAVLFGGQDGTGLVRGDTWEWNGFGWLARSGASGPQARSGHGLVFDSRRSRAVLFGGLSVAGAPLGDTWEWDGNAWQLRATASSPQARASHGFAFDSIRVRTVVHGGVGSGNMLLADTWEFDGNDWQVRAAVGGPSARRGSAMTFDDTRGNVVLFGGDDGTQALADTWTFDGANWTQRVVAGPSARSQAQMAHDTLCGRAVLHGGVDAAGASSAESWAWDGAAWAQLSGASPTARRSAAMAFDAQRGLTMLWGGLGAGALADMWQLASPCSRTMSVVTPPQVGSTAVFRFDYPAAAAGHFYFHQLTAHEPATYSVPIPGFASLGVSRVDLFQVFLQMTGWLDGAGSQILNVAIPPDNYLVGLAFDLQSVDIDVIHNAVYWGGSDAEVSVASMVAPVASFSATPTSGVAPLSVHFTDTSSNNPFSWEWDFNNDGVVDSTSQSPTHVYTASGSYSVSLRVTNLGGSDLVLYSNLIQVPQVVASFSASPASGVAPLVVYFSDTSTNSPTSWQWDFDGDGVVDSVLQNPQHTYATGGVYSVRLVASNSGGSSTSVMNGLINVAASGPPVARFTHTSITAFRGLAWFYDQSTNAPTSWQWDFHDDGIVDSVLQNPAFHFGQYGHYRVRLSVTNAFGTGTVVGWVFVF